MRAELAVPHVLSAIVPSSIAQMTANENGAAPAAAATMMMPLVRGGLTVAARADGVIVFSAMTLDLGSVTLPAGSTLTGVTLTLPGPVAATTDWRADQEVATATATSDLILTWSNETASGTAPIQSTQRIAGVPISFIMAEGKNGEIVLTVHVAEAGVFYRTPDQVELSDLTVDLLAAK
jgi:hypothetical protein